MFIPLVRWTARRVFSSCSSLLSSKQHSRAPPRLADHPVKNRLKTGLFVFMIQSCLNSSCPLETNALLTVWLANIPSPSVGFLFHHSLTWRLLSSCWCICLPGDSPSHFCLCYLCCGNPSKSHCLKQQWRFVAGGWVEWTPAAFLWSFLVIVWQFQVSCVSLSESSCLG